MMQTCLRCLSLFSMRTKGTVSKFCYVCQPFKSKKDSVLENDIPEQLWCSACNQVQSKNEFYRHSGNAPFQKCITCIKEKTQAFDENFKTECVRYKGGVCIDCFEIVPLAAFSFHHLDPKEKDFAISRRRKRELDETTTAELDKCVLLCCNCHAIRHAADWK